MELENLLFKHGHKYYTRVCVLTLLVRKQNVLNSNWVATFKVVTI